MTVHVPVEPVARNEAGLAVALPVLAQRFGERLVRSEAIRWQHGHTTTWLETQPPDAVVFPTTTEEVADIVRICGDHRVPVIPFGVGTSLEGHVNAPGGGVSVDMSRMNRVLAVHAEDLDVVVEAGVTRKQLNEYLRDQGLFFPIDPGADATLGGMAATRASGTNAVRYGTMRENVINLTAVMPNGEVIRTARRAKKSSAGYDLTRLLVGSEGTLGVITELTLRLHGIPEAIAGGVCPFDTVAGACQATILTIQSGIPVARIELLDALMVKATNLYSKLGLPEVPTLFVEFHGSEASVKEQSRAFRRDRARIRRRHVRLGDPAGGADQALAGAARRLFLLLHAQAGSQEHLDRRLRADFASCRLRRRDDGGHRAERTGRPDRRTCRRRELPPVDHGRYGRSGRGRARRRIRRTAQPSRHRAWTGPAPGSTASGRAR